MKLTTTTTYELAFSVEVFNQTEGGMDHRVFGQPKQTIQEALTGLEIANAMEPSEDWIIVVQATKQIK